MKTRLVFAALLAAAAIPLPARAQMWLSDRRYTEGVGIRVGDLELHPGLAGDFGYDSNYFARAEGEHPISVYRLRITPHLSLSTLGLERRTEEGITRLPPAVMFRLSAYTTYNELFPTESGNERDVRKQRHFDIGASYDLTLFPARRVSFDTYGDYRRIGEPSNNPDEDFAFNRDSMRAGAGATWRPGGGLFEWRLGYEIGYHYFEKPNFQYLNNVQHAILTRGRWRFLPRTALIYDAGYRFVRYTDGGPVGSRPPPDGDLVHARVGVNGLVTPRVSLLGSVGWASSFYDASPISTETNSGESRKIASNQDTIVAQAEARYYVVPISEREFSAPTSLSTLALGYTREIQNSYISSVYRRDRVYASINYFLGGAFLTSIEGGFSLIHYPTGREFEAFNQRRFDVRFYAEYRLSNSFGINTSLYFDRNDSDALQSVSGVPPNDDLSYTRWQAYLGLRWFM